MFFKILLIVFFLLIFIHNIVSQLNYLEENKCFTPLKKPGICIGITKCQPLMDLLKSLKQKVVVAKLSPELQLLQKSNCGFEVKDPKVCCEQIQQITTSNLNQIPPPPDVTNHKNLNFLDHNLCGPVTEPKVFGGNKTGVLEFPWMALLGYKLNGDYFGFQCGGTIISKRYILTAAHCVTDLPGNITLTNVRVGEHDISTERDCDKGMDNLELICAEKYQEFGIENIQAHFEYSRTKYDNDIALLKLDKDIDFGPRNVKPICLPIGAAATMIQKKVTLTGWGATEIGMRSQVLLLVHLYLVPIKKCAKLYRPLNLSYKQICAGGEKGRDSCSGDSGGPLQSPGIYNNDVRFIQYGVVSFGLGSCGSRGVPSVYTRVSYFMDWILDTIET